MEMTKEKIEELQKLGNQFNAMMTKLAETNGTKNGIPNSDAITKDAMEKMKTDIIDQISKSNPPKKKMVFDSKKQLGQDEVFCGLGEFMMKAKYNHPDLADRYIKTAQSEGDAAQGGYTVPVEYASEILGYLNNLKTIISKCTSFSQSAPTRNLPKWLTDLTVYWVAELGL